MPGKDDQLRLQVSKAAFLDEASAVKALLEQVELFSALSGKVEARARLYIQSLRLHEQHGGIEAFQQEYNLDSHEGIMMMCLAEALLRIPDKATADMLIHDKLATGDWDAHLGLGRPWLVNVGSYGLELAGKVVGASAGDFLGSLVHRIGEPLVRAALRHAMRLMGSGRRVRSRRHHRRGDQECRKMAPEDLCHVFRYAG